MEFFKKAAVFTDIHFGLKSNSKSHTEDCVEFVDWFIETAKSNGCDTAIFCGDWNHNRNSINIVTMNSGLECLEKLGRSFEQVIFFPGNHDLYYKDRRDMNSVAFGRHVPGITMVTEPIVMDQVAFIPWLVGDEWRKITKMKSRYMFGHFELPSFMMNAMVQMPDHGEIKAEELANNEYVFTGHFHKRQNRGNIHYIGNAFPHNFADAWDSERGMMILEWGSEPQYIDWPAAPLYRTTKLSTLIDSMDALCRPKMHLRVSLDIDISFEEANFIKETVMDKYDIRECTLIPEKKDLDGNVSTLEITHFESVDQIVTNQIISIDSENFDTKLLLEIYNNL
jgi:DNA repair exonuclease SbcCD nuclease subunit